MTEQDTRTRQQRLLAIYLNDHLMGARVGVDVARRCHRSNAQTDFAGPLGELVRDIRQDRQALQRIMGGLGVRPNPVKVALASVAEKVGRLKLNGQVTGYSPLSRVLELEGLHAGVNAKLRLWLTLQQVAGGEPRLASTDFDTLIDRAQAQLDLLEQLRLRAVAIAFPG